MLLWGSRPWHGEVGILEKEEQEVGLEMGLKMTRAVVVRKKQLRWWWQWWEWEWTWRRMKWRVESGWEQEQEQEQKQEQE